jgi:hypothetical protein
MCRDLRPRSFCVWRFVDQDQSDSVTVGVIRDLIKRVTDYERNASDDRQAFKATIEASLVQLRKDFHVALSPLQLDNMDHRRGHEADRTERAARQAANDLDRVSRQAAVDSQFDSFRRDLRLLSALIGISLLLLPIVAVVTYLISRGG